MNFSKIEKDFISYIINQKGIQRSIVSYFFPYTNGVRISVDTVNNTVKFLFPSETNSPTEEEYNFAIAKEKELSPHIFSIISLLEFLEENRFILLFVPATNNDDTITWGRAPTNFCSFSMNFTDPHTSKLLAKYIHKEIIPTTKLLTLFKNNFYTDDEINNKMHYVATWVSIGIAAFIGISSISLSCYQNSQSSISQEKILKKVFTTGTTAVSKTEKSLNNICKQIENIKKEIKLSKNQLKEFNTSTKQILTFLSYLEKDYQYIKIRVLKLVKKYKSIIFSI